jgi:preprotein translocase subunit SecF
MQLIPYGKTFRFMAQRKLWALVSLVITLGSMVLLVVPGPRLGTDFRGGTEVELEMKAPTTDEQIRAAAVAAGFSSPDVIRVQAGREHHFLIRVQEVSTISDEGRSSIEKALCFGEGLDPALCPEDQRATEVKISPGGDKISVRYRSAPDLVKIAEVMSHSPGGVTLREGENNPSLQNARENRVEIQLKSKGDQLIDGLRAKLGADVVPEAALRVEWVGPKAGAQLRDAAMKSIAISLVLIMVYIAVRFDLRFAPGAVIALFHDTVATMGALILLDKEINLGTVAALLTIIGFSTNDTVVVYDRVRENLAKLRGSSFVHIIDLSLSEMLNRTLLTSSTAILSLLAFFLWGTGPLKEFALTLVIGMVFGVYSSIYIALPLTHWLDQRVFTKVGAGSATGGGPRKAVRPKKEAAVV